MENILLEMGGNIEKYIKNSLGKQEFSLCRCVGIDAVLPAKSKRGREEGDGTENVINCRTLS